MGPSMQTGVWSHVAVTSQSGLTILYLNGEAVASDALPFETPAGTQFVMGYADSSRRLQGATDEVAVYNRALSPVEILNRYGSGIVRLNLTEPGPRLTVSSFGGGVLVSWPVDASGFVLESADNLGSGQWAAVSETSQISGGRNVVPVSLKVSTKFYRLHKP